MRLALDGRNSIGELRPRRTKKRVIKLMLTIFKRVISKFETVKTYVLPKIDFANKNCVFFKATNL